MPLPAEAPSPLSQPHKAPRPVHLTSEISLKPITFGYHHQWRVSSLVSLASASFHRLPKSQSTYALLCFQNGLSKMLDRPITSLKQWDPNNWAATVHCMRALEETSLFSFHISISFFSPPRYILTGALWPSSQVSPPLPCRCHIPIPPWTTPGPVLLHFLWDENPLDVLHLRFPPLTEFSGKQGPHLLDSQICILGPMVWRLAGGVVIKA